MIANDNWVEFTLRYIVDFKRRRTVKNEIFKAILNAIETSGGQVELASATFDLVGSPDINVSIKKLIRYHYLPQSSHFAKQNLSVI